MLIRWAPIFETAYSIRARRAPRSYSPEITWSSPTEGEASTKAHFPSSSHVATSQPKEITFFRISSGGSSKVINTPGSSFLMIPSERNWTANTVLALPDVPAMRVVRPFGSPPSLIRSKPSMPVSIFSMLLFYSASFMVGLLFPDCPPSQGRDQAREGPFPNWTDRR